MKINWIEGRGYDSNIFLIQSDINMLIDSGTGSNSGSVFRKLRKFGFEPAELDLLVNTHCHYDHTGGNREFIENSGCDLLASAPAAEALRTADRELTLSSMFGSELEPMSVSRTLGEGDEIDLGERKLIILSTPGHTKGSISLYEKKEKLLFSGDVVFKGGVGRTDLPSSDTSEMRETLKRLENLDIEKLYPGHGPIAKKNAGEYIRMAMRILGV